MDTTRPGDQGWTVLLSGRRVRKDDALAALCGEFDELSCSLGVARATLSAVLEQWGLPREAREALLTVRAFLVTVQRDLLAGGAAVSAEAWTWDSAAEALARLDDFCAWTHAHTSNAGGFVLPGACASEAQLHVCRALCRRVERSAHGVLAANRLPGGEALGAYLNRLSLALYGAARVAEEQLGNREVVPR